MVATWQSGSDPSNDYASSYDAASAVEAIAERVVQQADGGARDPGAEAVNATITTGKEPSLEEIWRRLRRDADDQCAFLAYAAW